MRFRLTVVVLNIALLGFLSSVSLLFIGTAHAQQNCAATYTVQWGDTLYSIALRFNSSVWELMALNRGRIRNPNYIFAGQTLCLPEPLTRSYVTLEATYKYNPNIAESGWTLTARGGQIGKRVVYSLQQINPIDTVSTTEEMDPVITTTPPPVLVGVRDSDEANTYTLVTVGREDILSSLRISGTVPLRSRCGGGIELKEALGDETDNEVSVTLWLEGRDGIRYPFSITRVDPLADAVSLENCYSGSDKKKGFALFPADSGGADEYRILMVLSQEGFGPPGRGWHARCSAWRGGRFYRWLRAWYGC